MEYQTKYKCPVMVAGDFNNRYVPLMKSYLPNSVVSPQFREDSEIQGCDWTDGFFYSNMAGRIHQPTQIYAINPATSEFLPNINPSAFSQSQDSELTMPRPFLCVAEEYNINEIIPSDIVEEIKNIIFLLDCTQTHCVKKVFIYY